MQYILHVEEGLGAEGPQGWASHEHFDSVNDPCTLRLNGLSRTFGCLYENYAYLMDNIRQIPFQWLVGQRFTCSLGEPFSSFCLFGRPLGSQGSSQGSFEGLSTLLAGPVSTVRGAGVHVKLFSSMVSGPWLLLPGSRKFGLPSWTTVTDLHVMSR